MSISSLLAMVFVGAEGNAVAQVAQALSLSQSGGGVKMSIRVSSCFSPKLVNRTGTKDLLRTANRLFGEKAYDFNSSFKDCCCKFYQAQMEELDFFKATEETRKHINTWVANKTEGKITELLSPNSVSPQTPLVLVNAIYFKGDWDNQFNKQQTKEKTI